MQRTNRTNRFIAGVALTTTAVLGLAVPGVASASPTSTSSATSVSAPVKSDVAKVKSVVKGTTEDGRKVRGTFTPSSFQVQDGVLMVTGALNGAITGHGPRQTFTQSITVPVQSLNGQDLTAAAAQGLRSGASALAAPAAAAALAPGACDILNLVLGPLDLNILGLEVHLNQVILDIVAQSGAGNLLGNLLCAVAGLLDGGGILGGLLGQISTLLNQILAILNLGV